MAGDWIPVDVTLPRKTEVLRIARASGRSRHEVIGLMVDFWCWAQHETCVDGDVDARVDGAAPLPHLTIDDLCETVGGDDQFWRAVCDAGWLTVSGDGLAIPRADRWMSNGAKARMQKSLRQKKWRNSKGNVDGDVDARVDGDVDADAPTCASTREEKRREDIESGARTRKSIPPTLEEVTQYVEQSDLSMSPSQFFDHFQSNGWMVGRNKMRDWQAAVRKWAANQPLFAGRPSKAADDNRSERGNPWR